MKINWLYVGIGAIVLYLLWRKFSKPSGNTSSNSIVTIDGAGFQSAETPLEVRSDVSQGDMVNELAFASGVPLTSKMAGSSPCFCNGHFIGYTSNKNCRRMCRRASKNEYEI